MKVINLNESQFGRIFEGVTDADFGKSSVPEYEGLDKVSLQPTITDRNGAPKKAKPMDSNKFADQQCPQGWGFIGGKNAAKPV